MSALLSTPKLSTIARFRLRQSQTRAKGVELAEYPVVNFIHCVHNCVSLKFINPILICALFPYHEIGTSLTFFAFESGVTNPLYP